MTTIDLMDLAMDLIHPGRKLRDYPEDERQAIRDRLRKAYQAIGVHAGFMGSKFWFYSGRVSPDQVETFLVVFGHPISRSELEARMTLIEMSK